MRQKKANNQFHIEQKNWKQKLNKFDPYRIKNNYLNNLKYDNQNINYIFQQKNLFNNNHLSIYQKQPHEIKKQLHLLAKFQVNSNQIKNLMDQLTYNDNSIQQIEQKHLQQKSQDNQEDFNQLWNTLQTENKQQFQNVKVSVKKQTLPSINSNNFNDEAQKVQSKLATNDSDSSFQLTLEELEVLMQPIEQNKEREIERTDCRKNRIYMMNQVRTQPFASQEKEDWGSWTDIREAIEGEEFNIPKQAYHKKEKPEVNIQSNGQVQCVENAFSSKDQSYSHTSLTATLKQKQDNHNSNENLFQVDQNQKKQKNLYGPWKFNTQLYKLHSNCAFQQIQQLLISTKSAINLDKSLEDIKDSVNISLRKINWQILYERKIENNTQEKRKNCKSSLLEHGNDFLIFDHYKFIYSPIREGVHLYLGIRSFGDFSLNSQSQYSREELTQKIIPMKDFLYLSSNGQCLLETIYEKNTNNVDKFNIVLCLTKQKIAVCQRIICNQSQDRREFVEIRAFDRFQNKQSEFLGIIQSKISKFYGRWYCDTTIYIPKKKIYSKKLHQKNWEKLKMKLKVSELGTIAAQLGILVAKSSVTNCILLSENNTGQFMMGTLEENCDETNYIIRIEGISPIMAFATAIARKFFVFSP